MNKVFITGAAGFVGSNLTHRLIEKGMDVHVLVRPKSNLWRLRAHMQHVTVHKADLTDQRAVERIVKKMHPDIIYHVAAHSHFLKQEEAEQMIPSDVLGTVYLLEALRDVGTACRIVTIGNYVEYDSLERLVREDTTLRPLNAYGVSKVSQSFFAQYYARFYKMPIVIVRPTLLYGPYEAARRLVPDVILAHLRGIPLQLSSPHVRKNFLFVEDALDAFEIATTRDIPAGEVINIASAKEHAIHQVVAAVSHITGAKIPFQWESFAARPWDSTNLHTFDIKKAADILGWQPQHTLEQGLAKTITWFKDNKDLYNT